MLKVNVADLKAKLSEYLDAVSRGEQVIICNRNVPVAELKAIVPVRKQGRDLSPMFPDWKIDPAFFDPLTDEELAQWEGTGETIEANRVAESQPRYRTDRKTRRKKS